jgi:uncharacterized membrane protein
MNKISNIKVETIFLVFCLFFGVLFTMINPPFLTSDEQGHFIKAFDVSQGHFIPKTPSVSIPKSFVIPTNDCISLFPHVQTYIIDGHSMGGVIVNISVAKQVNYSPYFKIPFNINDRQKYGTGAIYYMPLPYLAVAFVIKVGELFNTSPLILMYFGRLINLFIYAIIVYFGIKIVPIGKYLFLLIGLMPTSLYVASAVSADSLNLGLSILQYVYF